jgi:hypothetical protein
MFNTLRAAIVQAISEIENIGVVHDYQRYATSETAFRAMYVFTPDNGAPAVRGWYVERGGLLSKLTDGETRDVFTAWRIQGYMGWNDAERSADVCDGLIDKIRAALVLPGKFADVPAVTGDVHITNLPAVFAGVLCHAPRIEFETRHRETAKL